MMNSTSFFNLANPHDEVVMMSLVERCVVSECGLWVVASEQEIPGCADT